MQLCRACSARRPRTATSRIMTMTTGTRARGWRRFWRRGSRWTVWMTRATPRWCGSVQLCCTLLGRVACVVYCLRSRPNARLFRLCCFPVVGRWGVFVLPTSGLLVAGLWPLPCFVASLNLRACGVVSTAPRCTTRRMQSPGASRRAPRWTSRTTTASRRSWPPHATVRYSP